MKQKGAALLIKDKAFRSDALSLKSFAQTIIQNHVSWLAFANDTLGRGISLRDIVLVTGCDLTNKWTIATFDEETVDAEVCFSVNALPGSTGFGIWGEWQSEVHVPNLSGPGPLLPPPLSASTSTTESTEIISRTTDFNQCIFIRGYHIIHRLLPFALKLRAAAEPQDLPRDSDPFAQSPVLCEDDTANLIDSLELLHMPEENARLILYQSGVAFLMYGQIDSIYEVCAQHIFEVG